MEYVVYLVLSPIAFAIIFITATVSWKYRSEKIGQSLLIYFFLVLLFLVTNIFELMAVSEGWMLFWTKAQISFYSLIPVSWVAFALNLTRAKRDFVKKLIYLLLIIPFFTVLLVSTYPLHNFFYTGHSVYEIGIYSTLDTQYGPFFWVFGAHDYLLLITGAIVILKYIYSESLLFRKQVLFFTLGCALPLMANILYILPLPFFAHKDFTPLAFAVSGLFFFISIFWHRFLEIIPYARNIIIDEMDQGMLILDPYGVIVDANKSLMDLFSLKTPILGKTISSVAPVWDNIMEQYLLKKQLSEVVMLIGDKKITCSVMIKPILLDRQVEYGVLITFTDISLLVGLYDEKLDLLRKMEDSYKKLNSTKIQLIHKEKLASIGYLSEVMAQKIKDPLGFITDHHRFLENTLEKMDQQGCFKENPPEYTEIRNMIEEMGAGLERILNVVDNLLIFTKQMEDETINPEYDLNSAIDRTVQILSGTVNPSLTLDKTLGNLPVIECYGSEINQVLLNLLTNAFQAAGELTDQDRRVKIQTWSDGSYVYCSIANTGPPIDSGNLQRIFDPFYTTKEPGKGTGLGLSTASDIVVHRHSGSIDVDRQEGMTVFTVSLPIRAVLPPE